MLLAVVGGSYDRNVRPECVRETSSPDSTSSNTTSNLVTRSAFFTTRFDGDLLLVLGPEDLSIFRFGDFTGVEVDFLGGLNLIITVKNKQTNKQTNKNKDNELDYSIIYTGKTGPLSQLGVLFP